MFATFLSMHSTGDILYDKVYGMKGKLLCADNLIFSSIINLTIEFIFKKSE